jgi:N-acetylmuramoyl-L-alanine amidase
MFIGGSGKVCVVRRMQVFSAIFASIRARFAPARDRNCTVLSPIAAGLSLALASLATTPAVAERIIQDTDRVPASAIKMALPKTPPARRSAAVPAKQRHGRLPRIYGDDDRRPLVVIDAGHGGVDPGAISPIDGRREKDVTLKIARAIRDELVRAGRVRVALTREDDRFLILRQRYGIARRLGGALFISIHCDSVGSGAATGASVYTLSEVASDRESARLAARENKSDIIAGVNLASTNADISSILIDLTQRETMNASAGFARLLGREARDRVPLKPNFHRMASLMVLKAPDMPSVLFETGYISNPADAEFIDSEDGRRRIAQSVERAVEVHFARRMANR